jgi:hypothetical protein
MLGSLLVVPAASGVRAASAAKQFWRGTIEVVITETGRNPESADPVGLRFHATWTIRWRFRERPPRRNLPDTALDYVVAAGRATATFVRRDLMPDSPPGCVLGRFASKRFAFRDLLSFRGYPVRTGISLSLGEIEPPLPGFEQRRQRNVEGIDRTLSCDFTYDLQDQVRIPAWVYLPRGTFRGGPKKGFLKGSATTTSKCTALAIPAPWYRCGADPDYYKSWKYRVRVDLRRVG